MAAFAVLPIAFFALLLSFLALERLLHQSFVRSLLSLFNLQQRVCHHLQHGVALRADRWTRGGAVAHNFGAFLELFSVGVVLKQDSVDASLSEKIALHFFRVVAILARGGLVHPVDAGLCSCLSGSFLETLNLFHLALLLSLAPQLVDLLALLQRAVLVLPYPLLVFEQAGMP